MINQVIGCKNNIPPKTKRNMTMEKEGTSYLNKMSIFTFTNPILLRTMSTR